MSVPPDLMSMPQRIQGRQTALDERTRQSGLGREQELAPAEQRLTSALNQPLPQRRQVPLPQKPPEVPLSSQDFNGMTMAIIGMAMLAGKGKGRWMDASTALNGAMEGFIKGHHDLGEQKYQEYQRNLDAALQQEKQANQEFGDLLNNRNLSINELFTQVKMLGAKWDRQDMRLLGEQKSIDSLWKTYEARVSAADKFTKQREDADFRKTEALRRDMDKAMKPVEDVQEQVTKIKQLLATDSPAADKQVNEMLTNVFDRTRATNLLFQQNANFGTLAGRAEGFVSRAFTGQYTNAQRQEITDMVTQMEQNVLRPERQKVYGHYEGVAKRYGLQEGLGPMPEHYSSPGDPQQEADEFLRGLGGGRRPGEPVRDILDRTGTGISGATEDLPPGVQPTLGTGIAQGAADTKRLRRRYTDEKIQADIDGQEFPNFEEWLDQQGIPRPANRPK